MTDGLGEFIASHCQGGGPHACDASLCDWVGRFGDCSHPRHPENMNSKCSGCGHKVDRGVLERVGTRMLCLECIDALGDTLMHHGQPPGRCEE